MLKSNKKKTVHLIVKRPTSSTIDINTRHTLIYNTPRSTEKEHAHTIERSAQIVAGQTMMHHVFYLVVFVPVIFFFISSLSFASIFFLRCFLFVVFSRFCFHLYHHRLIRFHKMCTMCVRFMLQVRGASMLLPVASVSVCLSLWLANTISSKFNLNFQNNIYNSATFLFRNR